MIQIDMNVNYKVSEGCLINMNTKDVSQGEVATILLAMERLKEKLLSIEFDDFQIESYENGEE